MPRVNRPRLVVFRKGACSGVSGYHLCRQADPLLRLQKHRADNPDRPLDQRFDFFDATCLFHRYSVFLDLRAECRWRNRNICHFFRHLFCLLKLIDAGNIAIPVTFPEVFLIAIPERTGEILIARLAADRNHLLRSEIGIFQNIDVHCRVFADILALPQDRIRCIACDEL